MKMAKRVFVCLLALALCVSLLSVLAMADESGIVSISEIKKVLEYYEEPVIFSYDFDDAPTGNFTADQIVNQSAYGDRNTLTVKEGTDGRYLEIVGDFLYCAPTYFVWNSDEAVDDFLVDFSASASSLALGLNVISLYIDGETRSDVINSTPGTELVTLNFSQEKVTYADPTVSGGVGTLKGADGNNFVISSDVFYNVSVEYMVSDGAYSLTVSKASDPTVSATVEGVKLPCELVKHLRLGATEANMYDSIIHLDNINVFGGTFRRNNSEKDVATKKAISDILALVTGEESLTDEDKLELFSVVSTLVEKHGFVSEDADTGAAIDTIVSSAVELYAAKLDECLSLINKDGTYAERYDNYQSYVRYFELMPADISCVGAERQPVIQAIIDRYSLEGQDLASIKENSEGYIAALAGINFENAANVNDYNYLKGYYDAVSEFAPHPSYAGVKELETVYRALIASYESIKTNGDRFVNNVAIVSNSENSFGERYLAYVDARDNKFENETYPGVTEALLVLETVIEEMEAAIEICEDFMINMTRAEYSTYLNAKRGALQDAARGKDQNAAPDAQLLLIQEKYMEYPGMAEAVERHATLSREIVESEAAAEAYIAYVTELKSVHETLSDTELAARILEAERLSVLGNVTGYEGVTDANIALNNIKAGFELASGYKKYFSTLIGSLETEKDNGKRFDIINEALDVVRIAESYDGVNAGEKAELDAAISEYNENVKALNAAFETANSVAADVVSASAGTAADDAQVGRVVALIKKLSELELVPDEE